MSNPDTSSPVTSSPVTSSPVTPPVLVPFDSSPCGGVVTRTGVPDSAGVGTLRITLTQGAQSGMRYRLQGATFSLSGTTSSGVDHLSTLSSADSADGDELAVELPSGEYSLRLSDGWSLAALAGEDVAIGVGAARLSPRHLTVRIEPGADVPVRFRFEVSLPGSEPARAEVAPTLGVLERPSPLSGRVCLESPIAPEAYVTYEPADVAALEGCREVRGELYLGLGATADLSPLSQLERVCGTLAVSSTADSGSAPFAEQSLAGLEALAEVDSLFISHPGVRSLAPLSNLRRIQHRDAAQDWLGLQLTGSGLEDLRGLEQVTEIQTVRVSDSEALRSLRGLVLPGEMRNILVEGVNLADLSMLASVERVRETLYVTAGAVEDLSALANLRRAGTTTISAPALRDATGLGGLEETGYLSLQAGPLDVALPVFAALTQVVDLRFEGLSAPGGLSMPALVTALGINIRDSARLEALSLPALTHVGTLVLSNNAALASLDLPALTGASVVEIVKNAALNEDQLAWLEAIEPLTMKVGGNAGSAPLDPCPWEGDGFCDATFDGVCAAGTDVADCGAID